LSVSSGVPLPADTDERLERFGDLVATAIANADSRDALARLAEEQAALRRVATLVARDVSPAAIFGAVTDEVGRLFGTGRASVARFDPDTETMTIVGASARMREGLPVGLVLELDDAFASSCVYRTGRSARVDWPDVASAPEPVAAILRRMGTASTVASPIEVEGSLWGTVTVSSGTEPMPPDTEVRLEKFAELVATAIANAEGKSKLAASRRRIVTASDDTRRQIERDLHDGAQQRLVSIALGLRDAGLDVPPELGPLSTRIEWAADEVDGVIDDLRELARGIHPAILLERGLGPALRTLALRASVPVDLELGPDRRLPQPVEIGAYYVVSEALTNAAKHANASRVRVTLEQTNGFVQVSIADDGVGGVDTTRGSGLIGLRDRVEALGGSLSVDSAPGRGTSLVVTLPVEPTADTIGVPVT
jgi:signal transduction histidine kinase